MENLYFPIYQQIEKEVIELAYSIHFTDNQLNVYSIKIAELILRCAVEIESISKDIYRNFVKKEPKNPSACFNWMEKNWHISCKEVSIVSPFFHMNSLKVLKPFDYKDKYPEDYYSSYCAIKHDREKNLIKANLNTLIRSLAALYILILYYSEERFQLGEDHHASKLDKSAGSQIFIFSVAPSPDNILYTSEEGIKPENCIYKITREESEYAFKIIYQNIFGETKLMYILPTRKEYQDDIKSYFGTSITETFLWQFQSKYLNKNIEETREDFFRSNKVKKILSVSINKMKAVFWAELNI